MYIEHKAGKLTGPAVIGLVTFSRTGKMLDYKGQKFQSLAGRGFKLNYFDVETHEDYWISGCRCDGADRLYDGGPPVAIDEDIREEYWTTIRKKPENKDRKFSNK